MDIRQLRNFVRIVELGSLTRASEALRIAQPALGLQIRKLEDELHTQLLARHSRGMEPTPAGRLLHERALGILREVEATRQAVRDFAGPPQEAIKLGTTPSNYPSITVGLIQRSATELPGTRIEIQEAMTAELVDWVRSERIHLGLVYLSGDKPVDVAVDDLAQESAVFVQPLQRAPAAPTITLAEVCQHALVMPAHPHHLRDLVRSRAEHEGLELVVAYEIGAVSTILEMVERGVACSVLPAGAVVRHVADGRIIGRTVVAPELVTTLSLVRSSKRPLSKAEILLRALLGNLVAEAHVPRARCKPEARGLGDR